MASAAVWVGAFLTDHTQWSWHVGLAMLGAFAVCAAGNALNDIQDLEIDHVSHPNRPLVVGKLTVCFARRMVIWLHAVAVVLGAIVNWWVFGLAIISLGSLLAYNLWLKKVPMVGNSLIAVVSGLAFLSGGLAVAPPKVLALPGPWPAVVFAFFVHLAREIVKDVEDIAGDSRTGIKTLPQVASTSVALGLVFLLMLILAYLTLVPLWAGWYGLYYSLIVTFLIDLPLLLVLLFTWVRPSATSVRWSRVSLKAGMVLGMVALVLA